MAGSELAIVLGDLTSAVLSEEEVEENDTI